ncbi:MAG: DUF1501 domain-containing protein [Acidobacteria bacterium]|nr:DUF1501 domain-containing protein [Acidobacteriota bacterium]
MLRRELLGGLALTHLLGAATHHPAKAKRVIQVFLSGAASQCDTFDYKPLLIRKAGEKWDPGEKVELFQSNPGVVMPSPWGWKRYGQCGKWVSDLFPKVGACADDITFIHSMMSKSNVHGPATFMQNTGFILPGFPSAGAWVSYGLGSLNENLPVFVVMPDPRGMPPNGPANWGGGFLPAAHQATMVKVGTQTPIADLDPPQGTYVTPRSESDGLALLQRINRDHQSARPGDTRLEARIASYEMAARLQLSAPEVLSIEGESAATRKLYGLDDPRTSDLARRCLVARRMAERGIRFVQIWSGADNGFPRRNWDSHENLKADHGMLANELDGPLAALLIDLKARGMFEDTIVCWTTEFGRMPCSQGSLGRDHNPAGFTTWFAGGGFQGGVSYGATDEWSYKAVEKPVYCYDLHATLLHLLGIDHKRLTYRNNGIDRRLTDVHGEVIREILA